MYYIQTDQIGTPQLISDQAGQAVWVAQDDPFGAKLPIENPTGQGLFVYNPRFPGQYFDRETGLHYNYYRDYDPQTGRYVQSDPVGLAGGINSFAYVGGDPTSYYDAPGLNRTRAPTNGPTFYAAQVSLITAQIRIYNPSYNYQTLRPQTGPGTGYTQSDVNRLGQILRDHLRRAQTERDISASRLFCESIPNFGSRGGRNGSKGDLPKGPSGEYIPHPGAVGPHSTLGRRLGSDGTYYRQGATFDGNGIFRGSTHVSDHGSPHRPGHVNPHHHPATGPASTGAGVPGPLPFP